MLDSVTIADAPDMMYEKISDGTVNTMQLSLGTYLPATVELEPSKTKWTVDNTSAATIDNNGLLTAGDVSAQTEVTVTLSVTDKAGVEKTAVKKVKIQPVLDDSGLSIEGEASLDEELSWVSGKTKSTYTINNRTGITITKQKWSIIANEDAAEIDETTGVLTVKDINQIKTVTIQCEGEDASGYKVTKTHNVEISPILDSCTLIVNNDAGTPIFIGDEVALRITYDPGLNQLPLTETYDPVVPSNFTNMQRFETGEGNSNHPNWTFTAKTVSTVDTKEICVKAKVLKQGFERTCYGNVTVTPKLDSVSVTNTDTTIYENESITFQASATPAVPLKSEFWALNGTYDGVTLDTATGALTIDQSKITADTVVEVTYTATDEADVTKTAQGKVTIKPILEGITIKGANEIYEKGSDGTTLTTTTFELDTVTPAGVTLASKTWSIEGDAAGCTIDPSTGVLTAADISEEKTITVKLTAKDGAGNEKTASKTVKIKPILESVTITGGESEIFEKDAGGSFSTLQFGSEYTSTGAEIDSTTWSVTGTVAEIDNTGKLTVKSDISENTEVTVTLSMTDKAGNTKTDSKTVKIKPVLENLAIEGASDLYERTNTIEFPNKTTLTIKGITDSNISSKKWSIIDGTDGASIDQDGVLTAKDVSEIKNVKVQLEVTDINGSTAKAEKTVAIKPALDSCYIEYTKNVIRPGESTRASLRTVPDFSQIGSFDSTHYNIPSNCTSPSGAGDDLVGNIVDKTTTAIQTFDLIEQLGTHIQLSSEGQITVTPELTKVEITNKGQTIYVNQSFDFDAAATPDVTLKDEKWTIDGSVNGVTIDETTGALTIDPSKITEEVTVNVTYSATDLLGVTKTDTGTVTIKPVSFTIDGSDSFYEYTASIPFPNQEQMTVGNPAGVPIENKEWSIIEGTGATIDANGLLEANNVSAIENVKVQVKVTYDGGNTATAEKTVTIKPAMDSCELVWTPNPIKPGEKSYPNVKTVPDKSQLGYIMADSDVTYPSNCEQYEIPFYDAKGRNVTETTTADGYQIYWQMDTDIRRVCHGSITVKPELSVSVKDSGKTIKSNENYRFQAVTIPTNALVTEPKWELVGDYNGLVSINETTGDLTIDNTKFTSDENVTVTVKYSVTDDEPVRHETTGTVVIQPWLSTLDGFVGHICTNVDKSTGECKGEEKEITISGTYFIFDGDMQKIDLSQNAGIDIKNKTVPDESYLTKAGIRHSYNYDIGWENMDQIGNYRICKSGNTGAVLTIATTPSTGGGYLNMVYINCIY